METLLKRHFWAINLVGLAIIAWLAAGSLNALIGVQLSKASRSDDKPQIAAAAGESSLSKRLRDGRLKEESGAVMSGRSMFEIPEPEIPQEPEDTGDEGTDGEGKEAPPPEPTLEPTTLPIKLLGTMVVAPEAWSSASVEIDKNPQKIVNVGMELLDGKATVYAVRRNYLVLNESGKLTVAPLYPKEAAGADPANPGGPPNPGANLPGPRPQPRTGDAGEQNVPGVKRLADGAYQLDRNHVNEKLKDVTQLGTQVRIVPNYHGGKYQGFRMIGMGSGSLFADIGFANGDVVQAVNGDKIDSPNKALALYEALKNKARLTVLIERDGQPKTLRYTIR
ncbi:MAG: hypothetical protein HY902_10590 [Deltaproteobacteria bacterium]|nr:hypothetical protein [Deltaproteobacteria bacterium]